MFVCCECCLLSATRCSLVQRSSTDCGVSECDHATSTMRRPCATRGSRAKENKCIVTVTNEFVLLIWKSDSGFLKKKFVYRLY